jgi:hypothetical protein
MIHERRLGGQRAWYGLFKFLREPMPICAMGSGIGFLDHPAFQWNHSKADKMI